MSKGRSKGRSEAGRGSRGSRADYPVGYGRPPVAGRFKRGQSGKPKGRLKQSRNLRTVIEEELNRPITIREGERTRIVSKRVALVLSILNNALKGEPKTVASFLTLARATGLTDEPPAPSRQEPLTEQDQDLLMDFLARHAGPGPEAGKCGTSDETPANDPQGNQHRSPPRTKGTGSRMDTRLVAAVLRSDLYCFIRAAFPIVSGQGIFLPNWHIEAMAFALARVLSGETKRLIITVPPRGLKSICASVALPAFALGHDPVRRFICVSYSESLARKHANDCRALMRSPMYRRVFPDTRISPAKDTETEFATTARGYRLATSVGGPLTGRGGNFVIIDDPMKPQEAYSELVREDVKQWYSNTLLTWLDSKSEDAIVVVMQRLHVDDLVGYLLEQGGWTHLNLPAIAEHEHSVQLAPYRYHRRTAGDLLHSEREPGSVLDEIKHSMGSLDFCGAIPAGAAGAGRQSHQVELVQNLR